MSIDEQIKNAEIELLRLKALKEQKRKEFKPFEEIDWEAVYDHVVENYAKRYMEDEYGEYADDDARTYLYEYMLSTVCPYIFNH